MIIAICDNPLVRSFAIFTNWLNGNLEGMNDGFIFLKEVVCSMNEQSLTQLYPSHSFVSAPNKYA